MLWLWSVALLCGLLQPCCDVFAAAAREPASVAQHDCGNMTHAPASDTLAAEPGCDPAEHVGAADGPPAEPGEGWKHPATAAAPVRLPGLASPPPPPVVHAWRARGSPIWQSTARLRL